MPVLGETVEWLPPEAIIPNLPNEIALLCLAAVPRQYHPILAAVSKPIRSIVSSPEFFACRSRLSYSEEVLYLHFGFQFDRSYKYFAVYRDPSGESPARVAPIPPLPDRQLVGSPTVSLNRCIYFVGGRTRPNRSCRGAPTPAVWVLDCRSNTWSRGPDMLAARGSGAVAKVLGGKIYVAGAAAMSTDPFAEVLDPALGRWEALPDPPVLVSSSTNVENSMVLGNKFYAWQKKWELRFDTETQMWETREVSQREVGFLGDRCVVGELLYCYDCSTKRLKTLDVTGNSEWKEVSMKWVPQKLGYSLKLLSVGDRLMLIAGYCKSLVFSSSDIKIVVTKKKILDKSFLSIKVGESVTGVSIGEARWSEFFFPYKLGVAEGILPYLYQLILRRWDCFSVSL